MKKRKPFSEYIRISLSIPRDIWPYFERQTNSPRHSGNRSSYVRSLIVEAMERSKEHK